MKGQSKTGANVIAVLFASAALTLAQGNTVSDPAAAQPQGPYSTSTQPYQPATYQGPQNGRPAAAPAGPGTINYVEGQASIDERPLSQSAVGASNLQAGGVLNTQDGYVEVLLTPGAFLRVGHNSEIRMLHAGLADTQVQVDRGESQIEVDQLVSGSRLSVQLNGASSQIDKKGLYSFDAGSGAVRVLDGKATVLAGDRTLKLGKGQEVLLAGNEPLKKQDFDQKQAKQDPLYVWSRVRSEDIAKASNAAAQQAQAYTVADTGWFWNPYFGYYGFWPANAYLYSPFGWGFYSPMYFGFGYYGGYWGRPAYYVGHPYYHAGFYHPGVAGAVHAGGFHGAGFNGTGFHGGGFHGGGFHGGGHR